MKYVLPDYENCGLNVISSIMKHFGVPGYKKTHPVMDYFEIFMQRMILCRKAAEKLGLQFKLIINEQQLI